MIWTRARMQLSPQWQQLALLVLGAPAIAFLILRYGWWTLPAGAVVAIGCLALYRLDWALYAVIFLLPFTAIEGDANAYQVVIQGFKRVAVVALAAAWLVHVGLAGRIPRGSRWAVFAIAVLGTSALLSVLRAPEPMVALTSTGRLLSYALVYVVIPIDVLRRPEDVWRAVRLVLLAATATAAFALYQFVAHYVGWRTFMNPVYETVYLLPRVHSFMREPLWLSNYMLTVLPIALTLFCWRGSTWSRLAALSGVGAGLAVLLAASRLGWAVALLFGVLFVACSRPFVRGSRLAWIGVAVSTCLLCATAFWAREFGSRQEMAMYVGDFATFASSEHGEGDLRGHMRLVGLLPEALRSSPLIGIGTNNVGFEYYEAMGLEGPRLSSTHNTYLDVLIESGGLGLAAFLALIAGSLRAAWRGFRHAGAQIEGALFLGIWLGIVGMGLHLTNWSGWREGHVWFALGFAYVCQHAFRPLPADGVGAAPNDAPHRKLRSRRTATVS